MNIFSKALDVIHQALAVEATALTKTFRVIDKTSGVELTPQARGPGLPTVIPAAVVRVEALTAVDLTPAQLVGNTITFNGKTWRCIATRPRPTPEGESTAEVLLHLRAT